MSLSAGLRRRVESWARPRAPEPLPVRLDRRRIYILPTAFGGFLVALLATMAVGALNYNNNPALLLCLLLAACAGRMPKPQVELPPLRLAPASLPAPLALQQQLHFRFGTHERDLDALLEADAQQVQLAVQAAEALQWDLYKEVYPMVRHLIYYTRARVISVPRIQGTYALDPTFCMERLASLEVSWSTSFPMMRCLPQFLANLSAEVKPYIAHFAPRINHTLCLDTLIWLLRHNVVVHVHKHLRLVITAHDQQLAYTLRQKRHEQRAQRPHATDGEQEMLIDTLRGQMQRGTNVPERPANARRRVHRSLSRSDSSNSSADEWPGMEPIASAQPAACGRSHGSAAQPQCRRAAGRRRPGAPGTWRARRPAPQTAAQSTRGTPTRCTPTTAGRRSRRAGSRARGSSASAPARRRARRVSPRSQQAAAPGHAGSPAWNLGGDVRARGPRRAPHGAPRPPPASWMPGRTKKVSARDLIDLGIGHTATPRLTW